MTQRIIIITAIVGTFLMATVYSQQQQCSADTSGESCGSLYVKDNLGFCTTSTCGAEDFDCEWTASRSVNGAQKIGQEGKTRKECFSLCKMENALACAWQVNGCYKGTSLKTVTNHQKYWQYGLKMPGCCAARQSCSADTSGASCGSEYVTDASGLCTGSSCGAGDFDSQWKTATTVRGSVGLGLGRTREECFSLCKTASAQYCAWQGNGCYKGTSLLSVSSSAHQQTFQFGLKMPGCCAARELCSADDSGTTCTIGYVKDNSGLCAGENCGADDYGDDTKACCKSKTCGTGSSSGAAVSCGNSYVSKAGSTACATCADDGSECCSAKTCATGSTSGGLVPCGSSYVSKAGSTACTTCADDGSECCTLRKCNQGLELDGSSCVACPNGKYQDQSASTEMCKFCTAGFSFTTPSTPCNECTGGTYQDQNTSPTVQVWREDTSITEPIINNNYATSGWHDITSSSDGKNVFAVVRSGDIWRSIDSGVNWIKDTSVPPNFHGNTYKDWERITSSSDGTKLAAFESSVWTSSDSGVTWLEAESTGLPNGRPKCVASSSNGMKLFSAFSTGNIWRSIDAGQNWIEVATNGDKKMWWGITASSDGSKLAAVANHGSIWTSTNSGVNWHENSAFAGNNKKNWHV